MIDFSLTDEQKSLRELAHDFAAREIRPVAWEYDRDATWPQDLIFEKLMRDAKIMQLYEGTSQIQRLVIARETLLPRRVEERAAVAA